MGFLFSVVFRNTSSVGSDLGLWTWNVETVSNKGLKGKDRQDKKRRERREKE